MKKLLPLLTIAILMTLQAKSQCTFGSFPPNYTANGGWTNGAWLAQKYNLASTATLTGLGLNSGAANGTPFRMAIYTDASNTPGNLVAASSQGTMAIGPNLVSVSVPTVIPAGDYWLVAIYNGPGPTTYSSGGTSILAQTGLLTTPPANNSTWAIGGNYLVDYWAVINTPSVVFSGSTSICSGGSTTITAGGASSYTWVAGPASSSIAVNPTSGSIYTVGATNAIGCISASTISITVNALPSVSITGSSSVCAGSALSQTASGASTYSWNTGATTSTLSVIPTGNVTYTVTGTSVAGCKNTATVAVTVQALPTVTINGNANTCMGTSTTYTASGATSYIWSTGPTTNTILLTPTGNSSYTVTGSGAGGCINTATAAIAVNSLPTITIASPSIYCVGAVFTQTPSGAATYTWNTATPTSTTISYTVTGTAVNGCTNTAFSSFTINQQPTLTVAGNATICEGSSLSPTVSGANTYTWNTGATTTTLTVTPLTTTNYSVSGTGANGCNGSTSITVNVNPVPVLIPASTSPTICSGQYGVLSITGVSTATWNTGSNGLSLTVSPTVTTTYTVTGTNSAGCANSATISQVVDACTSIAKQEGSEIKISLVPNPSHGAFEIKLNAITEHTTLEIYSFDGKLLAGRTLLDQSTTVDLSGYANGLYYIIVRSQTNHSVLKLIKE